MSRFAYKINTTNQDSSKNDKFASQVYQPDEITGSLEKIVNRIIETTGSCKYVIKNMIT